MDYKEMIDFIVEQFNANHYGVLLKDGKVFDGMVVSLVPNGFDIRMSYRDFQTEGSVATIYPFERHSSTSEEAKESLERIMSDDHIRKKTISDKFWGECLGNKFWKFCLELFFSSNAGVCFDRFKDWTARSIFKTDDTVHVRFEVPKPMSEERFTRWALKQTLIFDDGVKCPLFRSRTTANMYDIPQFISGPLNLTIFLSELFKLKHKDTAKKGNYKSTDYWYMRD